MWNVTNDTLPNKRLGELIKEAEMGNMTAGAKVLAYMCAVAVRGGLEQIHARDDDTLPDSVMKEVNTIVRNEIFSMLCLASNHYDGRKFPYQGDLMVSAKVLVMPYWEEPELSESAREALEEEE